LLASEQIAAGKSSPPQGLPFQARSVWPAGAPIAPVVLAVSTFRGAGGRGGFTICAGAHPSLYGSCGLGGHIHCHDAFHAARPPTKPSTHLRSLTAMREPHANPDAFKSH
jgi:hypothetical protein